MSKNDTDQIAKTILAKEQAASDLWNKGDGSGFLELYREDVTFVEPFTPGFLIGKAEVEAYFKRTLRGIVIEKVEWSNEHVVVDDTGDTAILTYNQQNYIRSRIDGELHKIPLWNCTAVYRLTEGDWKIAHANWSLAQHLALIANFQELFAALGY